ncbi:MAG: hypothetical protein ACK53J_05950, partial [Betaproteobacteria bacterium]
HALSASSDCCVDLLAPAGQNCSALSVQAFHHEFTRRQLAARMTRQPRAAGSHCIRVAPACAIAGEATHDQGDSE